MSLVVLGVLHMGFSCCPWSRLLNLSLFLTQRASLNFFSWSSLILVPEPLHCSRGCHEVFGQLNNLLCHSTIMVTKAVLCSNRNCCLASFPGFAASSLWSLAVSKNRGERPCLFMMWMMSCDTIEGGGSAIKEQMHLLLKVFNFNKERYIFWTFETPLLGTQTTRKGLKLVPLIGPPPPTHTHTHFTTSSYLSFL